MMSGDELAFIEAICATPADDTPRLVYADWLQERDGAGDANRAEYIRYAIREKLAPHTFPRGVGATVLLSGVPAGDFMIMTRSRTVSLADPDPELGYTVHRGFVSEVTCTADDWVLRVAKTVFWHPKQKVPCPECEDRNHNHPDRITVAVLWACGCRGTGFVQRACPPTAQPIKRVALTTEPDMPHMSGRAYWAKFAKRMWPGLSITLPPMV